MEPRASLDVLEKRWICWPCENLNSDYPTCSLVIILTTLSWLHAVSPLTIYLMTYTNINYICKTDIPVYIKKLMPNLSTLHEDFNAKTHTLVPWILPQPCLTLAYLKILNVVLNKVLLPHDYYWSSFCVKIRKMKRTGQMFYRIWSCKMNILRTLWQNYFGCNFISNHIIKHMIQEPHF